MSSAGDRAAETRGDAATRTDGGSKINPKFSFVPDEFAVKCRSLIESFHGMYGYLGLPDMLWLSDARDIIECHENLAQIVQERRPGREARTTQQIVPDDRDRYRRVEMLARDFAGWGKRFPMNKTAKQNKLFGDASPEARTWLMDRYLFAVGVRREFGDAEKPYRSQQVRRRRTRNSGA